MKINNISLGKARRSLPFSLGKDMKNSIKTVRIKTM
tara:strand:+ start:292 stop:399 length:108 start_codon:yes stop_codon:yes gene_type:complete